MRRKTLTRTCLTIGAFLAASFADSTKPASPPNEIKSVRANGVTLHYIERGSGSAVVFVHGSIEDYRAWEAQMEPLAQHFHVIAYSRRYNFPNHNSLRSDGHS